MKSANHHKTNLSENIDRATCQATRGLGYVDRSHGACAPSLVHCVGVGFRVCSLGAPSEAHTSAFRPDWPITSCGCDYRFNARVRRRVGIGLRNQRIPRMQRNGARQGVGPARSRRKCRHSLVRQRRQCGQYEDLLCPRSRNTSRSCGSSRDRFRVRSSR
jgi:hypothetical protein